MLCVIWGWVHCPGNAASGPIKQHIHYLNLPDALFCSGSCDWSHEVTIPEPCGSALAVTDSCSAPGAGPAACLRSPRQRLLFKLDNQFDPGVQAYACSIDGQRATSGPKTLQVQSRRSAVQIAGPRNTRKLTVQVGLRLEGTADFILCHRPSQLVQLKDSKTLDCLIHRRTHQKLAPYEIVA